MKKAGELEELVNLDALQQLAIMSPLRKGVKEAVADVAESAHATKRAIAHLLSIVGCDAEPYMPLLDDQKPAEQPAE